MDTAGYLTELKKLLNDVIKESVKSGSDGSESDFDDGELRKLGFYTKDAAI